MWQAGNMADAERLYREIVKAQPDNVEALTAVGALCHISGRVQEAFDCLHRAIAVRPDNVDAQHRLGVLMAQQGQFDEAARCLETALRLQPQNPEIARNLRIALACREHRQGQALFQQGRLDEAALCERRAVEMAPDHSDAWNILGQVLSQQKKFEDSLPCFLRVAQLKPQSAEAQVNVALIYLYLKKFDDALVRFRRAVELDPQNADAHNGMGVVMVMQQRWQDAVPHYAEAIRLKPDFADAYYNMARAMTGQDRFDEALPWLERTLAIKPDHADARYTMALTRMEQNQVDEAADWYARTIELRPDDFDAHVGLALARFQAGRLTEAWPEYEWRLKQPALQGLPDERRWHGEPLEGRTIFVRAEQGAGDAIQFVRYMPMLQARGAKTILWCAHGLGRLMATCAGVDAVCRDGEPFPHYDYHVPLLSLPGIFGTTLENIPAEIPYIAPDKELAATWRAEFAQEPALKIGIAWKGSSTNPRDRYRSIPLSFFAQLVDVPGVRLYSLQWGVGREQLAELAAQHPEAPPVVDLGDRLGDFYNTTAVVSNLDLVITCDSAPAHLAGALGMPVWVALTFAPDWRWMLDRSDTPWYPTMRLFRQKKFNDWTAPFVELRAALVELSQRQGK